MRTPTFSSLSLLGLLSIAGLGAEAQTKPAAAPSAAPAAAGTTPPDIVETPYDVIEISPVSGKSGAKALQLKYNTKHYEDAATVASEAAELMERMIAPAEAEQYKFAIINAVKPEEPKGVKTIFERKPGGEWVLKGAKQTPALGALLASTYAKLDAASKARDSAAIEALETPEFGHYLANGSARTAEGDKEQLALAVKSVAAYNTQVIGFFLRDGQVSVVQTREWTGDFQPNKMAAVRKVKETTRSLDLWQLANGELKLLRSKELDEKMVKL